jgi:predicted amidophosphoribosyltransferase
MRIGELLAGAVRALREAVYPEGALCAGCGKVSDGAYLCPGCRRELEHSDLLASWECRDLDGVQAWSMRPHRNLPRKLVLRLKHGAESRAAEELAGLLRTAPDYFPRPSPDTVVTWVPAPRARTRERCIDHGRKLAEAVARELRLECRPLLKRRGNDNPQARLNREQRERNLRKAFVPLGPVDYPVLLVDDVLTTGTTALRCIAALRNAGAKRILVLTATHAVNDGGRAGRRA